MSDLGRFLLLIPLALLAGCGRGDRPRNVILITLDTTRADYLSCYGGQASTPRLDGLAAQGTRFDLAFSTASVTPVSHAAILTGLYNHRHGLRVLYGSGAYRLPPGADTLATVLEGEGYHTRAVHSAFPVSRFFGFQHGFEGFDDLQGELSENEKSESFSWDVSTFQRRSDETTDRVLSELGSEPFFLWVHYWDPHDVAKLPPTLTAQDLATADKNLVYAAEIEFMDAQIGRLLDALSARGLYEDSLIVVVADHGQGLNDHDWTAHRLLYQEQIRVPLIVKVPGVAQVPAVTALARTVDIYPTVLDYLGIAAPHPVSGRSLRPLIEGRADEPRVAFADQINGYDWNAGMIRQRPLDDFLYATMERDWKLVYRPRHLEQSELYHLSVDPGEHENLFEREPEQATRMLDALAREAPWVAGPFEPLESGDAAAAQAALSGLGYTGTAAIEAEWAWTCPRHREARWTERRDCPTCGSPPLLVGASPR